MGKSWIDIMFIYVGTVIGAGFASGREIVEFFGVYGIKGIWGIYISGILFSVVGSLILIKIYNKKISNFNDMIYIMFKKKIGLIIDIIINLSLYTGFSIMIAGSGAIFKEQLNLPFNFGIMLMLLCSFIVFLFNLEGLSTINSILVPLLIMGIIFISIHIVTGELHKLPNIEGLHLTKKGNFITSSILYFGSNCLIILVIFSSLLPMIDNKKTAIIGGTMGGFILYILGVSILSSVLIHYDEVSSLDLPMLSICGHIGENYRKIYAVILWIAMFTTALANGFGFINKNFQNKNKTLVSSLFCISAIPLAKMGFSNLVGIIYPIFGVIGFLMVIYILLC
ncbi:YkvI family membrane protein [Tissierellaceae bacterium HCP3S3_D8]